MINPFQAHEQAEIALMVSLGSACPQIGWNQAQFRCIPSGAMHGSRNSEGGFSLDADMTITCIVSDFGDTLPKAEQQINYPFDSNEYFRIVHRTVMAGGLVFRLKLESSNQSL